MKKNFVVLLMFAYINNFNPYGIKLALTYGVKKCWLFHQGKSVTLCVPFCQIPNTHKQIKSFDIKVTKI